MIEPGEEVVACREEMHRSRGRAALIYHGAFLFPGPRVSRVRASAHSAEVCEEEARSLKWNPKTSVLLVMSVFSAGTTSRCGSAVTLVPKVRKTSFQFLVYSREMKYTQ